MLGQMIPPIYPTSPPGPADNNTTTLFTGGPWRFTRTAASGTEDGIRFDISDDTGRLDMLNHSITDGIFVPKLRGLSSGVNTALVLQARINTDTGTNPAMILDSRSGASTALGIRPNISFQNAGTEYAQVAASGAFRFGFSDPSSVPTSWQVGVRNAPTDTSGVPTTIVGMMLPNPASASTGNYAAVMGYFTNSDTDLTGALGYGLWGESRTAQPMNILGGLFSRARATHTAGTVASVYGANILSESSGAGNVTNMYGAVIGATNSGGGVVGTYWGVRVNVVAALATTTWAFYADSAPSYFGGGATFNARLDLKSYTVATLPAVGAAGGMIYVSDAAGTPCAAISNGTNWKRCDDMAVTVS